MSGKTEDENSTFNKDAEHITCTDDLNNMHITCTEEVDICANCGKEGGDLNICNKCKEAKYCNAACKKKHRSRHKKKCVRRAAELYDERLFKPPPLKEDCPICMLPLPSLGTGSKYYSCCGKTVCSGCIHAPVYDDLGNEVDNTKCAFCRAPAPTSNKEALNQTKKRMEVGDSSAINNLGLFYSNGLYGLQRNQTKAFELYHQAGELGYTKAYCNIGNAYHTGEGVERDEVKADHYYELAAIGGNAKARHNLGNAEWRAGNLERALKHYTISAGDGQNESVKIIQQLYMAGCATKEDYAKALQAYQAYLDEIKSGQRDEAAAFSDEYKYY